MSHVNTGTVGVYVGKSPWSMFNLAAPDSALALASSLSFFIQTEKSTSIKSTPLVCVLHVFLPDIFERGLLCNFLNVQVLYMYQVHICLSILFL